MTQRVGAETFDVIVAGSGAGGLSAAVVAAKRGLNVLVLEKSEFVGGTTARSGGVLWIPGNPYSSTENTDTEKEAARNYIKALAGNGYDADRVEAFLDNGPKMVDFFETETEVAFAAQPHFPDYHPDTQGASEGGRAIVAAPLDGRALGNELARLRPPLREITFVGMMFNASQEVQHFFRATRSISSAIYVAKRLAIHGWELLRYRRAMRLTNGNALAARLFASALGTGVEVRTNCGLASLVEEAGEVRGVVTDAGDTILARRGVVLATGGFPRDIARQSSTFPHVEGGDAHHSPAPETNTGSGLFAGEAVGAKAEDSYANAAAWIPVSRVPYGQGEHGTFPHLLDRYKPGIIAVDQSGRRFVNEAESYHVFGQAMLSHCRKSGKVRAWLLADHAALRRYGLGMAKPFPVPYRQHLRSGYLKRGSTPAALARKIGCDPEVLAATIARFNADVGRGHDDEFGKGDSIYNRYLGDPENEPNPCLAALEKPPYYAVELFMGDLGTFAGLRTDTKSRVLDAEGRAISGLYACGNDMASVMGGAYPGGGITLGPAMTFGYIAANHMADMAG